MSEYAPKFKNLIEYWFVLVNDKSNPYKIPDPDIECIDVHWLRTKSEWLNLLYMLTC